jgi:hypothetical protein
MKGDGVNAAIACPRVTEKTSVMRTMKNWYPARELVEFNPGM